MSTMRTLWLTCRVPSSEDHPYRYARATLPEGAKWLTPWEPFSTVTDVRPLQNAEDRNGPYGGGSDTYVIWRRQYGRPVAAVLPGWVRPDPPDDSGDWVLCYMFSERKCAWLQCVDDQWVGRIDVPNPFDRHPHYEDVREAGLWWVHDAPDLPTGVDATR